MHRRMLETGFSALGCLIAVPALAQEPPALPAEQRATVHEDGTVSESVSYGSTVGLLYGIGYAGMTTGFWAIQDEQPVPLRVTGAIAISSGAITTVFGPMLAHFDHGFFGKGLLSAGGQLGAAGVGLGAGYGVAKIAGADETGPAMLIGAVGAHISWALFDIFYLAREERVLERTVPAPSYSLLLGPEGLQGIEARARFEF
jgi:hypothetical protein